MSGAKLAAARMSSTYTGHAAQGGLQAHSIGDEYPYLVYGKQRGNDVVWCILDCETGYTLDCEYMAQERAMESVQFFKEIDALPDRRGRCKIGPNGHFTRKL